ncbi:alpha/beta hydrolase [Pseudoroseicyclus aestuarii]|uniref:Alpha/beta hydrolase family protein n=1 Tax=Pseudoroseicyclus aestuarii TaxID=1795041 RepID=A0A318STC3_9RHOB|nr:alpha/beta hydrolase [Pseudoroseicyclus aestuarii]PYE82552.1 alpha/beta hydrolase family protein [Pseudoroseicyclus aestuarii]
MSMEQVIEDIANEYHLGLSRMQVLADGRRYWPDLFVAAPDGYRPLTARLTAPAAGQGPAPLVVYIHGGGWRIGHPGMTNRILREMDIVGHLNAAGFAVAEITYRMSSEACFPAQIHDCKAAVRYLRRHAGALDLDPDRFAAMGESAGGHLALLLGLELPEALEGDLGVTGCRARFRRWSTGTVSPISPASPTGRTRACRGIRRTRPAPRRH